MINIKYCFLDNVSNLYIALNDGKEFTLKNDRLYYYRTGEYYREATKEEIDYINEETVLPF